MQICQTMPKAFLLLVSLGLNKSERLQALPKDSLSFNGLHFPHGTAWRNCLAVNPKVCKGIVCVENFFVNPDLRCNHYCLCRELETQIKMKVIVCIDTDTDKFSSQTKPLKQNSSLCFF